MIYFVSFDLFLALLGVFVVSKKKISRESALKIFTFFSFVGLLILSGCRGLEIGNDTPMYVRYFYSVRGLSDVGEYSSRFEPLFRLFTCVIAQIKHSAHLYLFVCSLLTLFAFYYISYKESSSPWYSVLLFIFLLFYNNSMCLMRQYLAIGLVLVAYEFLKERQYFRFGIFAVAAGLTHTSALVILIMLPIMILPFDRKKRGWYIAITTVVALLFEKLVTVFITLMPRYSGYLTSDKYYLKNQLGTLARVVINLLLFLVVDYVYAKYTDGSDKEKLEYMTALLGFAISLASLQGAIVSRISTYFVIVFCISIPNSLNKIPNRRLKYQLATLIVVGAFIYNMIVFIFRPYWSGTLPYTFWA